MAKILHICKKYPQAVGGDATVVANLVKYQRQSGQTVAVLTSNCPQINSDQTDRKVYKFGLLDQPASLDGLTWRRLVSLVLLVAQAFWLLKKLRPDVVHTHSIDLAVAASLAARFYGVPIVHTFHIVTFNEQRQAWWRRKIELGLVHIVRPRLITAPNDYDVAALRRRGLSSSYTLPNGLAVAEWLVKKPSASLPDQPFTFVVVGRLEAQKGCDYVIRAVAKLVKQGLVDFRVVIIGNGSLYNDLAKLVEQLGLTKQVVLVGQQDEAAIRQAYADAQAMIIASLWETTPLTLLEAWAQRLPVIATPVGILQDEYLAARTVVIVPPANADYLAKAMVTMLQDWRQFTPLVNEAQLELTKYDWSLVGRLCQQFYNQVSRETT